MSEGIEKDAETFLKVGNPIFFYGDLHLKHTPRYHSTLRGWQRGTHILIDRPKSANGGIAPLQEGQECSIRFLNEGLACGFESQVIDWDTRRFLPFARVRWPKEIKKVPFRKFERVKVRLACVVKQTNGEATPQEMRDLSLGGCSILSSLAITPGEQVQLSLSLPDTTKVENLNTVVRSCAPRGSSYLLGCEFAEGQDLVRSDITFYVITLLELQRDHHITQQEVARVLLMDANTESCLAVRDAVEQKGFDAFMATNAIDGIHRLRMFPPKAVLINEVMPGTSGTEICRIIRTAPGYTALPIVLYGFLNKTHTERGQDAGATATILAGDRMIDNVVATLEKNLAAPAQGSRRV